MAEVSAENQAQTNRSDLAGCHYYPDTRPWTRWWWYSGAVDAEGISRQLEWVAGEGFGGVEIAWVYPLPGAEGGPPWLSADWSALVEHAAREASRLGLGCDYTFGTLWPFGDSQIAEEDAAQTWSGASAQRLRKSWEDPLQGRILDHLNTEALSRYAARMGRALRPAVLPGRAPAFFCDSWEVHVEGLWTGGFGEAMEASCGYDPRPFLEQLDDHPAVRYDYRKFLAQWVLEKFYLHYAAVTRQWGGFSRVQCHGAPVHLLDAYAAVEVPESETILFDPAFSQIAASAAVIAGRPIVSCEAFTCLYGFRAWPGPGPHQGEERAEDVRIVADALLASGVNHFFWHGMPYRPVTAAPDSRAHWFYASVHVGPDGALGPHLSSLNQYLAAACRWMRMGQPLAGLAVYLPMEDAWMAGELPPEERRPSGQYHWELHNLRFPREVTGYAPVWVSGNMLEQATGTAAGLTCGTRQLGGIWVSCSWLDPRSLAALLRLARSGVPVHVVRRPDCPGQRVPDDYHSQMDALLVLALSADEFRARTQQVRVVEGDCLPLYAGRVHDGRLLLYFAHPKAAGLRFPLAYDVARQQAGPEICPLNIHWAGEQWPHEFRFRQGRGILCEVVPGQGITEIDLG